MANKAQEELDKLPRLSEDTLGKCLGCGELMLAAGFPVFYHVTVQQCGIDLKEVNRHVGLAMSMGGGPGGLALASVLGPGVKPVVELSKGSGSICLNCSNEHSLLVQVALGE